MTLEGKHNFCFTFFVDRAEVLLHLFLHRWRRRELMKIGFIGTTQLKKWGFKKERVGERGHCNVLQTISPA